LQNCRKLPVFQLAVLTELFHLVITDNQGPTTQLFSETDTLPTLMDGPSYKAHNPIYLGCCTLNPREAAGSLAPNKSFLSTCDTVSVQQFLTDTGLQHFDTGI
jgi:hypothetical protein